MRWWDIEDLLPLERELFGDTAWNAVTFWSELAHPLTRWYVLAEEDDPDPGDVGPLGYAGLMVNGPEADVQTLAVAPRAQGRGVGTRLLRALLGRAAAQGASSVLLEVRADNEAAIALYRGHGFERIALRRGYYQPGAVDAWVMRLRPLRPAAGWGEPTG
jgi:ribosomal-protein-alanine N-acetyltransferase